MRHRREIREGRKIANEMRKAAKRVRQIAHTLASEGDVQPSVSRTGHVVLRCELCGGKVCYLDKESAERAVEKIPDPMTAYFGRKCGFWHLATRR